MSIAKEGWELGHLKAIKEEDERRAEIEEDDMLYLESSPSKASSAGPKHGRSKPKLYSYGGWEFASFDDDAVASFLDDDGSQNVADDATPESSLANSRLAAVRRARGRQRKSQKTKPSALKNADSPGTVPRRKLLAKKRRAEFGNRDGSTEKEGARKRLKIPKMQKLPKKIVRSMKEKDDRVSVESVTLDGRNVGHKVRLVSPNVGRAPRLKAVKEFARPMVQHRPLVRPIRSSELGMRPRLVRMPANRTGPRTIAEIGARSPPQPTPILEKLGATVLASPSSTAQPSRLTQIVSSISALQNAALGSLSSSPGTVQYVIATNGQPAIQQTSLVIGGSSPVGTSRRTNIVYQVPPAVAGRQQLAAAVRPSQPARLVLPSSATSVPAARQSFVLTAPGGDRQSFVLLPTSNRQSYILAPAAASHPATSSTASSATGVVRGPASFTVQLSPPRLPPRAVAQQQPIQPAPIQRTIQLAAAASPPRNPAAAANTLPILEKFALQLNSAAARPGATYEVVAHSGELIAAGSPVKAPVQQIVCPPTGSPPPPSQIVRLSGAAGAASGVQLVVGGGASRPAVQTITMTPPPPQFVVRQPRHVVPTSSIIAPAILPVHHARLSSAPRIVSGTNLVQVPNSQLSTVIIVDSSPVSRP